MIEPLRFSFEVDCRQEHAFDTWTSRIGTWWPVSHSVTVEDGLEIVLRVPPRGPDLRTNAGRGRARLGRGHDLGATSRLGYLWHLRRDRADATDVEIRFVAHGVDSTRVEIEHRSWERLGAEGPEWRDRNRGGWESLLPHYRASGRPEHGIHGLD